jgi:hypothetical protein
MKTPVIGVFEGGGIKSEPTEAGAMFDHGYALVVRYLDHHPVGQKEPGGGPPAS